MEAPESVVKGIKAIKPTFSLFFNPEAKVVPGSGHSFDVNGRARKMKREGRWEVWDVDAYGQPYKVMTLQEPNGGFRPADQRLVEFLNLINPERYNGDVSRMIEELVEKPNEYVRGVEERDFERLVDSVANYYTPARGHSMVTVR